ncbi:hypothetical protein GYB22_10130, partial [bacterium]|nr:hypothetical protein [bacterium]
MIAAISYRNIWRNKQRSLVVMFAIAIGIWGALLVIGLAKGLTGMRHDNAVSTYVSHIQVHDPDYLRFGLIENHIDKANELEQYLAKEPQLQAYSPRIKIEAFLQSTQGNSALILNGIKPDLEQELTVVSEMLEDGNYFNSFKRQSPIIISKRLSERLNLDIGAKLRMSFSNVDGQTVSTVYKVIDIFQTGNSIYDEVNAFVPYTS